ARAACQLGHAFQSADRCNRHDAGDNWDVNARERTAFPEIEKVVIIEKQLCDDVISASIHFCFEMIHLNQSIWGSGMSLGETSNSDPETAAVRMGAGFVEAANKFYQVDRVLERVARFIVTHFSRSIAAERENVSNGGLRVSAQNRLDFLFVVADTGKMRDRVQFCCVLNALDEVMGQLTRRATGAISHANKVRHV